mgnify:CR=1 FL=1
MSSTSEAYSEKITVEQDRKLLLLEAPNFSRFLEQTFEGTIEVTNVEEVRQGFESRRNKALSLIFGPDRFRTRIDEDRFYELQKKFPGIRDYFIGPFYVCLRTNITFRLPKTPELIEHRKMLEKEGLEPKGINEIMEDIFTRIKGELRVYPEFRDKDGTVPMTYKGFRPGVGYHNRNGVDYIGLTFGPYSSLVRLVDNFDAPWAKKTRGHFWKSGEWKRYDGHTDVPFP